MESRVDKSNISQPIRQGSMRMMWYSEHKNTKIRTLRVGENQAEAKLNWICVLHLLVNIKYHKNQYASKDTVETNPSALQTDKENQAEQEGNSNQAVRTQSAFMPGSEDRSTQAAGYRREYISWSVSVLGSEYHQERNSRLVKNLSSEQQSIRIRQDTTAPNQLQEYSPNAYHEKLRAQSASFYVRRRDEENMSLQNAENKRSPHPIKPKVW